jgi:hypothetical protein
MDIRATYFCRDFFPAPKYVAQFFQQKNFSFACRSLSGREELVRLQVENRSKYMVTIQINMAPIQINMAPIQINMATIQINMETIQINMAVI